MGDSVTCMLGACLLNLNVFIQLSFVSLLLSRRFVCEIEFVNREEAKRSSFGPITGRIIPFSFGD